MVFCWCPLAYLAIKKFWKAMGLIFGLGILSRFLIEITFEILPPMTNSFDIAIRIMLLLPFFAIVILPMLYFMRKWCIEWNNRIDLSRGV